MASSIDFIHEPTWHVEKILRSVRLYSSSGKFLETVWESISTYSKTIDSQANSSEFQINIDERYRKYVDLTEILPQPLQLWLGNYPDNEDDDKGMIVNSHGAALVAAGVFPAMSYLDSPDSLPGCKLKELPPNSETAPGDIVLYETNPKHFSQSCVYINEHLCFTMDVFSTTFTIQSFFNIEAMHVKRGVFATVRLFRKEEDWEIPPELTKAYGLKENVVRMKALYEEIAEQLCEKREAWLTAAESIQEKPIRTCSKSF